MATSFAGIPPGPLSAYLGVKRANEEAGAQQIGRLAQLLQMKGLAEKQQQEGIFRSELVALGPNPTQEQLSAVSAKYATPRDILTSQTASLDRKEAAKSRAQQFIMSLDARQQELDRKRDEFMQRTQDNAARQQFEQWYKTESLRTREAQNAATNELRKMGLEITRQGQQIQIQRLEEQGRQTGARNVQQLGTALERANLPEADATLKAVEQAIETTPDLPSYISGPKSTRPDWAVSKEIATGRQAFQKLMNITLKDRSGAAVTIPEFERLKQEFATGIWKRPEQFTAGVTQARNIIKQHYRSVAAGFGPDILRAYNENMRIFGGSAILEPGVTPAAPSPSGIPSAAPAGVDPAVWSVMTPQEKSLWQK